MKKIAFAEALATLLGSSDSAVGARGAFCMPPGLHRHHHHPAAPRTKIDQPSRRRRNNHSLNSSSSSYDGDLEIIRRNGFRHRLVSISNDNLSHHPMPAEIYDGGSSKLCLVTSIMHRRAESKAKQPLLKILLIDDDDRAEKVVDVGQLTTLWKDWHASTEPIDDPVGHFKGLLSEARDFLRDNSLQTEKAAMNLYNNRMANRSRPTDYRRRGLTKKKIPKVAAQASNPSRFEDLLRNLLKVGDDHMSRLVDSEFMMDYLYPDFCREGDDEQVVRRLVAAHVLSEDAKNGGRFRRRSCQFASALYGEEDERLEEIALLNGGWIAVDASIKSAVEGQKFASSAMSKNQMKKGGVSRALTAADERIIHRLECLAMGDVWRRSDNQGDRKDLEVDVRETLIGLGLPLSSEGARSALIEVGRWSNVSEDNLGVVVEPWSADTLEASRSLVKAEEKRRTLLLNTCKSIKTKPRKKPLAQLEDRFDLSSLPCVCIDAKRTSFRDDAIGIRLRSSTGRKVSKAASKWEVLIHIADVSDIYLKGEGLLPSHDIALLRHAAEQRGMSRYDLPLGPLHLLPPVALKALSLKTDEDSCNRCVTLWAYIDERDGKLLEAGLERTLIASPTALTFADATSLLDCDTDKSNVKAVLSVAHRNLSRWSRRHANLNEAARKREDRLSQKELISNATGRDGRDDGVGGSFQRSRGHRLVDSSLDLYAFALGTLMRRANQPIPRAPGSMENRGGRLGTAPLRRYIDGMAQRQAIAVLCDYGGKPLTKEECRLAARLASKANEAISNIKAAKDTPQGSRR